MVNGFADILGVGTTELIIILVIVLLLFGSKKLPELSKSVGSSIKELRKGMSSDEAKNGKSAGSTDKS